MWEKNLDKNFKVVQFEFPAFFIQLEKQDLHPKKPELYLKKP